MFRIAKTFEFSAAHQLKGLPDTHPCSRLHGHNYSVEVVLESKSLDEVGFVVDYRELGWFKEWIDNNLDHRNLNEVFSFNPTAENLARYLFGVCKSNWCEVVAVSVSETAKTWATYVNEK
jgi:6-pyruvoyltetrahydropterin/6-carboxytetrahydropterin synthase